MADLNSTIVRGNLRVTDDINTSGTINGNGSGLTNLNASNIGSGTLNADRLATSGASAGSYGPSANAEPGYGTTFNVPYITVDNKGRVTAASTKTVKIPASDNTNTATAADDILDGSNIGTEIKYTPYLISGASSDFTSTKAAVHTWLNTSSNAGKFFTFDHTNYKLWCSPDGSWQTFSYSETPVAGFDTDTTSSAWPTSYDKALGFNGCFNASYIFTQKAVTGSILVKEANTTRYNLLTPNSMNLRAASSSDPSWASEIIISTNDSTPAYASDFTGPGIKIANGRTSAVQAVDYSYNSIKYKTSSTTYTYTFPTQNGVLGLAIPIIDLR